MLVLTYGPLTTWHLRPSAAMIPSEYHSERFNHQSGKSRYVMLHVQMGETAHVLSKTVEGHFFGGPRFCSLCMCNDEVFSKSSHAPSPIRARVPAYAYNAMLQASYGISEDEDQHSGHHEALTCFAEQPHAEPVGRSLQP